LVFAPALVVWKPEVGFTRRAPINSLTGGGSTVLKPKVSSFPLLMQGVPFCLRCFLFLSSSFPMLSSPLLSFSFYGGSWTAVHLLQMQKD